MTISGCVVLESVRTYFILGCEALKSIQQLKKKGGGIRSQISTFDFKDLFAFLDLRHRFYWRK